MAAVYLSFDRSQHGLLFPRTIIIDWWTHCSFSAIQSQKAHVFPGTQGLLDRQFSHTRNFCTSALFYAAIRSIIRPHVTVAAIRRLVTTCCNGFYCNTEFASGLTWVSGIVCLTIEDPEKLSVSNQAMRETARIVKATPSPQTERRLGKLTPDIKG